MTGTLDVERLRKVAALMDAGATAGERAAARSRAEAIAAAAGMRLDVALSKLDDAPPKSANIFDGFDDWMEQREPGFKAARAAERAERERHRRARCKELLAEYGSEDAVFAETERERLLRVTLEPLADWRCYMDSTETYIVGYAGWTCRKPPPKLWEAIESAYPLPMDISAVWQELREWEALSAARRAFNPEGEMPVWVRAREAALESLMDTVPAPTVDGFRVRLDWLDHLNRREFTRDAEEDRALFSALRAGFEAIAANVQYGQGHSATPSRRTNAEKRADVMRMLAEQGEWLSDREIARRVGVSPQTVNTWRKRSDAHAV